MRRSQLLQVSAELGNSTDRRLRQEVKLEEQMETARAEKNRFHTTIRPPGIPPSPPSFLFSAKSVTGAVHVH